MKKLQLKKEIIADMNKAAMNRVVGGDATGGCETIHLPCKTVQPCIAFELNLTKNNCVTTNCLTGMYPTLYHCF